MATNYMTLRSSMLQKVSAATEKPLLQC